MNLKSFLCSIFIASFFVFTACDDDLNSVGNSILPDTDDIQTKVDSVYFTARTIQVDSVYARTINGLLGKYEDEIFGTVKADYLCEFYCPDSTTFYDVYPITIDSAQFVIDFSSFTGDSLSQMGVSLYEVSRPLEGNYYTNIDPTQYCDMSKLLGQTAFSVSGLPFLSSSALTRSLKIDLGKGFGQEFYNAYKSADNPFVSPEKFKQFFPGIYITSDFGSGTLIQALSTSLDVYYTYTVPNGNHDETADTTYTSIFTLSATPEVFQMNRIENQIPSSLLAEGTGASYLKSPAGVFTELTMPIKQIADMMRNESGEIDTTLVINQASLSLIGYTEKENTSLITSSRVPTLLMIDKDSVNTFFENSGKSMDFQFCDYVSRTTSNNTFVFDNLSRMILHYAKLYKDGKIADDYKKFVLVPVSITSGSTSSSTVITGVYNYMLPATSILRTDDESLKMKLIFSKY